MSQMSKILILCVVVLCSHRSTLNVHAEDEAVKTYNGVQEMFTAMPRDLHPHTKPEKENPLKNPNQWLQEHVQGSRLVLKNCQVVRIHPNHRAIIVSSPTFRVGASVDYKVRHRLGPGVYCDFKEYDLEKKQLVRDDWENVVPMLSKIRLAETYPAVSLQPKRTDGEIKNRGSLVTLEGTISQVSADYRGLADHVTVTIELRGTRIRTP